MLHSSHYSGVICSYIAFEVKTGGKLPVIDGMESVLCDHASRLQLAPVGRYAYGASDVADSQRRRISEAAVKRSWY